MRRWRREQEADGDVAVLPAACLDDPVEIDRAMRLTHDGLLELTGPHRRGPVTWRHVHGAAAPRLFEALFGDWDAPDQAAASDQFRAFFAEHGERAVLVVASCPAVRPDGAS